MAIFRKVHTSFWSDSFTSDLTIDQKLFYIYLLTNERTKQCGVYEITKKQISFDLGYSIDKVSILLKYFISKKKIKYNEDTKELAIGNWLKYNSSTSPKVVSCINKEFLLVKDTLLIEYVKSIDTLSQEEEEQEEEEQEEEQEPKKPKLTDKCWIRDFVSISPKEHETLRKEFSEEQCNWMYDKLNNYKLSSGKKYKSDYGAINSWVKDELIKNGMNTKKKYDPTNPATFRN